MNNCFYFFHKWSPYIRNKNECVAMATCIRCMKTKYKRPVHHFMFWENIQQEKRTQYVNDKKIDTFLKSAQIRRCEICNFIEKRYLD